VRRTYAFCKLSQASQLHSLKGCVWCTSWSPTICLHHCNLNVSHQRNRPCFSPALNVACLQRGRTVSLALGNSTLSSKQCCPSTFGGKRSQRTSLTCMGVNPLAENIRPRLALYLLRKARPSPVDGLVESIAVRHAVTTLWSYAILPFAFDWHSPPFLKRSVGLESPFLRFDRKGL